MPYTQGKNPRSPPLFFHEYKPLCTSLDSSGQMAFPLGGCLFRLSISVWPSHPRSFPTLEYQFYPLAPTWNGRARQPHPILFWPLLHPQARPKFLSFIFHRFVAVARRATWPTSSLPEHPFVHERYPLSPVTDTVARLTFPATSGSVVPPRRNDP